jgi:hypothetical protein
MSLWRQFKLLYPWSSWTLPLLAAMCWTIDWLQGTRESTLYESGAVNRYVAEIAIISFAMMMGCIRLAEMHPAGDIRYLQWLRCTPWTHTVKLPRGRCFRRGLMQSH